MLEFIKKLVTDERGQDLAEYGIALAVIAVGVGAVALAMRGSISQLWENADSAIKSALGK